MKRIALFAVEGPVTSFSQLLGFCLSRIGEYGDIQVFKPPIVSYFPFPSYPLEMMGGMLQQAALWPCIAML